MRHDLGRLLESLNENDLDASATVVGLEAPSPDELSVRLSIVSRPETVGSALITCRGVAAWVITSDLFSVVEVTEEHPALLPWVDDQAELFFTGAVAEPTAIQDQLVSAHRRVAGRFIDFEATILERDLVDLLGGRHGKLADGPSTLLAAYQQVLEKAGVRCSVLLRGRPKRYIDTPDGGAWTDVSPDLGVLTFGYDSYVVAEEFNGVVADEPRASAS
jgi:hypothetical protein